MFWIHGGGNTVGSGTQPRIDGRRLALTGNVVGVTLNYRLGVFGWLHAPILGAYGNEGLLDQTAALFWVRREIAAFGGDPSNVTVFGQSAGGFDIAHLMAMLAAMGAFGKAIPMSGSLIPTITKVEARAVAEQFLLRFGGWDDPERMRTVSADDLLDYQVELTGGGLGDARFGPVADGHALGLDAEARIGAGIQTKGLPLLIGHTKDEFNLFTATREDTDQMSDNDLLAAATTPFGGMRAAEGIDRYQRAREARGERTDNLAVWSYRFDYPSPAHDGRLCSCHSLDIPFIWSTYEAVSMKRFCGEATPQLASLSETMMQTWLAFAHTNDPNHERLPVRQTYDADNRAVMPSITTTRSSMRPATKSANSGHRSPHASCRGSADRHLGFQPASAPC